MAIMSATSEINGIKKEKNWHFELKRKKKHIFLETCRLEVLLFENNFDLSLNPFYLH